MRAAHIAVDALIAFAVVVCILSINAELDYQEEQAMRKMQAQRDLDAKQAIYGDLDKAGRDMVAFDRIAK